VSKPTHKLIIKKKTSRDAPPERSYQAGVAWENDKGWISIALDPCTVLKGNDDFFISLYPLYGDGGYDPPDDDNSAPF
jgi:hypothetical protein